jgi:hypothetical protein
MNLAICRQFVVLPLSDLDYQQKFMLSSIFRCAQIHNNQCYEHFVALPKSDLDAKQSGLLSFGLLAIKSLQTKKLAYLGYIFSF